MTFFVQNAPKGLDITDGPEKNVIAGLTLSFILSWIFFSSTWVSPSFQIARSKIDEPIDFTCEIIGQKKQ